MVDPEVLERLAREGIPCCLIGAAALSAHGYARYTHDIDLLVVDRAVLRPALWVGVAPPPEICRPGLDDPLDGLVRFAGDPPLDLIVGRGYAAQLAVSTAEPSAALGCPISTPLSLALLKLEAGSPQDCADLLALATVQRELGRAAWVATLAAHATHLTASGRKAFEAAEPQLDALLGEME
ncbi:MAG: hypothetical protein ACYCWW_15750 [Deltaproteobacteria bacterium]